MGINYSGMHDSSIAIVGESGKILFASSLERLTRIKQDGRPPFALSNLIPWEKVLTLSATTDETKHLRSEYRSLYHPDAIDVIENPDISTHDEAFYSYFKSIDLETKYICHQKAHASSAAWSSNFLKSLVITYDGGMTNCSNFGGVFEFDRNKGVKEIDLFSSNHYRRITLLYTFVTAMLGFSPMKHEGKVTGLSGYAKPTSLCMEIMNNWFYSRYEEMGKALAWKDSYSSIKSPSLEKDFFVLEKFYEELASFDQAEIAASLQELTHIHMEKVLNRITDTYGKDINLCLAGGLFANVKLNSHISQSINGEVFVAPFMSDDGTAVGSAFEGLRSFGGEINDGIKDVYLGFDYTDDEVLNTLQSKNIQFHLVENESEFIAENLAKNKIIGRFNGRSEFGPRALGNRSILASVRDSDINDRLNEMLLRTDFMPFAPALLKRNFSQIFMESKILNFSDQFMTRIFSCNLDSSEADYSIVHEDGTARPQVVYEDTTDFGRILQCLDETFNHYAVLNTSFNVHEEPIVETPEDALRGFFISGLDILVMNRKFVVFFEENRTEALTFLQDRLRRKSTDSAYTYFEKLREQEFNSSILSLLNELKSQQEVLSSIEFRLKTIENHFVWRSYRQLLKFLWAKK